MLMDSDSGQNNELEKDAAQPTRCGCIEVNDIAFSKGDKESWWCEWPVAGDDSWTIENSKTVVRRKYGNGQVILKIGYVY